jgi:hypothetical protein
MAANISFNPILVTTVQGSFSTQSDGMVQGVAMDDPAIRFSLAGGILNTTETLPMWGGVGVSETVNGVAQPPADVLGPLLGRATSVATLSGFSVFNQAAAWITTPQSECPSAGAGMTVPFYRLGSGARIAVACDPSMVSLEGGASNAQVSWDFNDQMLAPYVASGATEAVTSLTWSNTNGGQVAVVLTAPGIVAAVGDIFNVSGVTNTGTGALTSLNGPHVVNTFTDSTHFTFLLPGTAAQWGTLAGTIVVNVGVGALPCKLLGFNFGNSKTVQYDPVLNFVHWNNAGSAALILI